VWDLYAPPQHVDLAHAAWWASEAILAALGGDPCKILQAKFAEFYFYEFG
jgi:hypothetical protein